MFGPFPNDIATDINDLRQKINENKGGRVRPDPVIINKWELNYNQYLTEKYGTSENLTDDQINNLNMGFTFDDLESSKSAQVYPPSIIIEQEAYEYEVQLLGDPRENRDNLDDQLRYLFSEAGANTEFETCMNTLLDKNNTTEYCEGLTHSQIQTNIKNLKNIANIKPCEINYIEDKLKRISIITKHDAKQCMELLNISETCTSEVPVSTRMLRIAYLIFHVVGLDNINLHEITVGSPEYQSVNNIVNRLTPFIKKAIYNIIDISKHYELKTCGKISTTTHMLDTLYGDLFIKSKEVSVDFKAFDYIPQFLIKDSNIDEFVRSILLMALAISAVYAVIYLMKPPIYVPKST